MPVTKCKKLNKNLEVAQYSEKKYPWSWTVSRLKSKSPKTNLNLNNLTKNQGSLLTTGRIEHGTFRHPSAKEPPTTRSATPAVGTHPHYLREGLEPKGYGLNCHLSWMFVCTKRRLLAQKHSSCMPMYCKHMGNCKTIKPMQLMRLEEWLTGHNSERGLPM